MGLLQLGVIVIVTAIYGCAKARAEVDKITFPDVFLSFLIDQ